MKAGQKSRHAKIKIAAASLVIETVSEKADIDRGLSGRKTLPKDHGMFFVFDHTARFKFWMKGMRFALDMIWIGEDMKVAHITNNVEPPPLFGRPVFYSPTMPVRYVLEVNAFWSAEHGIKKGDMVEFVADTMSVALDRDDGAREWNNFVTREFPPVGAFMQSFEWGEFKKSLHGSVKRFSVVENNEKIACAEFEAHTLPFGISYVYAPRGPVIRKDIWQDEAKVCEIFSRIGACAREHFPHSAFIRFEPPEKRRFAFYTKKPFRPAKESVQPRLNEIVTIRDDFESSFSHDLSHDIRSAERRGITVEVKDALSADEEKAFEEMKYQTSLRSGKNLFPRDAYFDMFLKTFIVDRDDRKHPRALFFVAKNAEGRAVAINLNILFADTLTYLYGVSYSGSLSKRAPAYLHFRSIVWAKDHSFRYYDLGGTDGKLWHGLTYFKRQFGGHEMEYVGAVDLVFKPFLYNLFLFVKSLAKG